MIFVADYLALGLVITLSMFFFDSKTDLRYMSSSGRIYLSCLVATALTAAIDMASVVMHDMPHLPLWLQMTVNSLYFVSSIVTTTSIALYLFTKMLEHNSDARCMRYAYIGLSVLQGLHLLVVVANWWTGWLFYFEDGLYHRGPLNALGYVISAAQMLLVILCYFRNRKTAVRSMRRVLLQTAPLIPICIIVNRLQPGIMLNPFILAMVDTVLFLTFMGQRQGIHSLTELNDLHRFYDVADRHISRREPFAVLLLTLRDFTALNQKYGHRFGDEFLYQFAAGLDRLFPGGLAFHLNGSVFAVLLRTNENGEVEKQTERLQGYLNAGISHGGDAIVLEHVVVQYVSDGTEKTAAELYEIMEHVLIKAYGLKHSCIRCTAADVEEMARERYLRERLRKIDREHGYEVWFQPVHCLASERFCSMEALIRLREPDGSMISPAEFIPLAEKTGQVNAITWFVLDEACRMLNTHPELADITVSINLPMVQMLEKDFVRRFTAVVDGAGINHHSICIEFTERAILGSLEQTKHIMEELGHSGFRFYLDDFGAGYSNFNCITQLPFQTIKLDRSLVRRGRNGSSDYSMVCTLTKLLHDMELVVIAEGAETPEEVQALSDQGIDRIQGFALAMPMAEGKLVDFYRARAVRE